ncbi:MAG TPA: hypothetical protein VLG13_02570 [Patescibacteria group bacterium]|nr:hypothetical protein [Patescibacteria group bacterium]
MLFKKKSDKPMPGQRRSRSMGQRQSPAAFSYYAQRSDRGLNTGREVGREEQSARRSNVLASLWQRTGMLVLLAAIIAGFFSGLSLSTNPRIIPLSSASSHYFLHSNVAYQQAAASILSSSLWNRNKITVSTSGLSQKMKAQFPELASVSVTLPLLGHRPLVYIQPNQPTFILSAANGSYVLDQKGTVLLPTTQLPANIQLNLPVVTDQTSLKASVGHQALTSSDVAFIQAVVGQLQAHKLAIASLTLPASASELDVRLNGQPYFVKFNLHASLDDARQQVGTFIAVKNKLDSQHVTPGQYIDVRVDSRAYYQ